MRVHTTHTASALEQLTNVSNQNHPICLNFSEGDHTHPQPSIHTLISQKLRLLGVTISPTSISDAWLKALPCICWNPGDGLGSSSESRPSWFITSSSLSRGLKWHGECGFGTWHCRLVRDALRMRNTVQQLCNSGTNENENKRVWFSYVWLTGFNQKVIGLTDGEGEGCLGWTADFRFGVFNLEILAAGGGTLGQGWEAAGISWKYRL